MIERPFLEFRLDAAPFGLRALELLTTAADLLKREATVPSRCAAALLTADGAIHAAETEIISRETYRHALSLAVMKVLHGEEHRILMAALVRRLADGSLKLMLPCGNCRMLLHAYGGPELRVVHACRHTASLTLIHLHELLPYADGGAGMDYTLDYLKPPG